MSLHVHSQYSALDGISTTDEIANRMVEIGCPYCGLTDHGVVAGHLAFDKSMRSRGLNPVFGAELYHGQNFEGNLGKKRDQAHLLALAMTDEGLKNLWRLVNATASRGRTHFVGRTTWEDIERYHEGIVFTSACPLGLVPQGLLRGDTEPLNRYLDICGDSFHMELTTYPGDSEWTDRDSDEMVTPRLINELVVEAAYERGVPLSIGDDGHYSNLSQYKAHDLYIASQTGQSIYTPIEERKMWHPEGALCIKDKAETRAALSYLPSNVVEEAMANTDAIGNRANAHLPNADKPHLPIFIPKDCPWTKEEETPQNLFVRLVEEGIKKRYGGKDSEDAAWAQALHEMEVLMEDKLEHYFLWTWDVIRFCDENGIIHGPGRGSGAGSIVAYALGITDVDPLYYDLYFERFWNKGRTDGFPDIDTDFARSKRGDVREYIIKRLGEKRVCSIGTITRMKPKAVVDRLGKGCAISYEEMDEVKRILDDVPDIEIHGVDQIGWSKELEPGKIIYVEDSVGPRINKWVESGGNRKEVRRIFIDMCRALCSRNEGYGIHPSGIVISDIDLDDYAPAYLRGGKETGIPATMFPMKDIDNLRLVKLDILGLKTLDTLAEWEKLAARKGTFIDWSGLDKEEWPDEMWDMLEDGFWAGIFQGETPGGKRLGTKMKPRSIEDLGVLVAMNRPGPIRAGVPDKYFARKNGTEAVTYPHELLEEILKPTYGLFLFQEQIIKFMGELGYSLGEADAVRKILGKKQPEKLGAIRDGIGEWEGKGFIVRAVSKGFSEKVAREVWQDLEGFASYSFNSSHSIAYGIIAFRCLLAKYYAPAEFYTACIRTVEQQKRAELTPQYVKEARRLGIEVFPPDIRYSLEEANEKDGNIYFGFSDIKGVASSGSYLVYLRDELGLDISTPESLCDSLEEINDAYLAKKKLAAKEGHPYPKSSKSPKQEIGSKKISSVFEVGGWDQLGIRKISLREKQAKEKEYLGVILSDNTQKILANSAEVEDHCDLFEDALIPFEEKFDDCTEDEIPNSLSYQLYGIVNQVRPTKTKKTGAPMGIVTIENGNHELEFIVFPIQWGQDKFLFKERSVGVFKINQTSRGYNFENGRLLK